MKRLRYCPTTQFPPPFSAREREGRDRVRCWELVKFEFEVEFGKGETSGVVGVDAFTSNGKRASSCGDAWKEI